MAQEQIEIEVYTNEKGQSPFLKWLNGLKDVIGRAKVRLRLDRLMLGNPSDTKSLGGGLHELRIDFGPGYRLYYGYLRKRLVLLLCRGDKKSQAKDIEKAKLYWNDYRSRHHEKK